MQSYHFARDIRVDKEYDLVVAGGGPAGTAAAVCAARLGVKVLLVEATGCLGGMGTSGLVCAFDPMADGEKNLVGGLQLEIVEKLYETGGLGPQVTPEYWRKKYHCWTQFRVEALKKLLDELTVEAGVEVRFFTRVIGAEVATPGQRVDGVILHNIEGLSYVPAKTFIDCTGDAVLANLCGVECLVNEHFMPGTLCSLHAGIDWDHAYDKPHQPLIDEAVAKGFFSQPDRHVPGLSRVGGNLGYLNAGHLFNKNPLKCADVSSAMMQGRRLVREFLNFYRTFVPGCENMELVTTAALMGVRETRRIVGEMQLTYDDYVARRQFPDQIGIFNKFVDIHVKDCSPEEYQRFLEEMCRSGRLGPGECFGLPYGILVPRGWENLWVAGRCNSSDERVHGSIRVMPAASMMGQAAGTAACQSLKTGQTACNLNTAQLVQTLRQQNANLPQEHLSDQMTRR